MVLVLKLPLFAQLLVLQTKLVFGEMRSLVPARYRLLLPV